MNTPVVLIIFKRPHTTEKVFEAIRAAKPPQLFVIADGARSHVEGEVEKCEQTRRIIDKVDWECEVIKNYSEINLGCAKRVSSGLDWVFNHVDEAIILEDDCVPHLTFFQYCEELLIKYRDDKRISSISGQNVQFGTSKTRDSYYFSTYNHCWGWATWKRAWQNYDLNIQLWQEVEADNLLFNIFQNKQAVRYWHSIFETIHANPSGITWDYQWMLSCWLQNQLSILPNINLVANIGFGSDSTHFQSSQKSPYENLPTYAMEFPLQHPKYIVQNLPADRFTQNTLYREYPLQPLKQFIKKTFKKLNQSPIKIANSQQKNNSRPLLPLLTLNNSTSHTTNK